MTNSFILIDTSIWIDALSKKADKQLISNFELLLIEQKIATTSLIKLELLSGCSDKKEFNNLSEELDALHQLEFTADIWHQASKLGFLLRKKGLRVPNTDLLLAAASIAYNCPLWHRDKHFDLISEYAPLKIY